MFATKTRNRLRQIPQARPADLSAFRYKQNASLNDAGPPDSTGGVSVCWMPS